MPAANNLQDENLADKQGPTGMRLPTCIHHTVSSPAMHLPHLQRKRNCDHLFSDSPAAAPENLSKRRKKNRCSWAFYQFFHPEAAFEEFVTEKNLLRAEENSGHFCEKPTTTPPALHTACASPTKIILFLHTFVKSVGRSKVDVYNWILHYPNPHYTPVCLKGWQYPLPQMSTVHAQLLQKRRIYHYPWILSWKVLFLLTFTNWRVFPKWHQVILFKKNISFSYFSLSAMNMRWNGPHPHASQFTPTAQALLQQKFWRSAALKQPQTRTSLRQGLGKRACLCSSIRRKGRSKYEHSPMACFPAQSTSLHRTDLLLWTRALSVEPNRRGSWPCAQTTSNSPVTVLRADGYLYTLTHGTVHLLKKETSNKDFQTCMLKTKYSVLKLTPANMYAHIYTSMMHGCMHVCQCLRMSMQLLLFFEGLEVAQLYLFHSHKTAPWKIRPRSSHRAHHTAT